MSTVPPNRPIFRGGVQLSLSTAQRCLLHKNVIIIKIGMFSGVLLKISLIFKKFYNIMKYIIKIFLHQSCSPLDAEHRYVSGIVK